MAEVLRFGIVGVAAVLIQYGAYLIIVQWLSPTVANTIAYALSFVFNYVASTRFTFRVKSNVTHGAGFALSHAVNYLLQTLLLNLFIFFGMSKQLAMIPMFAVCVPVNFVLVRYFLKR
ncbi:GtrA-like protein [Hoylesella oralis ATCC 33269]|uniref:GtrA-like protein n=1 Tax=Hoylesella oralis ATCC 33269 TaxID=873533 RepID=E7RLX4_9BACT|nr:GtrA-like protein [Hoylesella oralis ATCC 33269]